MMYFCFVNLIARIEASCRRIQERWRSFQKELLFGMSKLQVGLSRTVKMVQLFTIGYEPVSTVRELTSYE